ncbi:DUF4238 domain-containing protein [Caballeronia sp. RCC_10]|uniref:DUF4238 domain-containing protein n=1 Tax=Caballeronia sp. RCC_10 TaxID=3239227 RepID=UPI0035236529
MKEKESHSPKGASDKAPRNHHYVPKHFLKAWSVDPARQKVHRYKWIPAAGKVEFKRGKPITACASANDLYTLSNSTETHEFESSVMTDLLDTPGSKILRKIRHEGIRQLSATERTLFAQYVVSLEARNPVVMEKMHLSGETIDRMATALALKHQDVQGDIGSVAALMKGLRSTGTLAAGAYVRFGGMDHARALSSRQWVELQTDPSRPFFTSNYPVGRCAWFDREDFFACLAVSPTLALFFVPQTQAWHSALCRQGGRLAARMLSLLTLRGASEAYTRDSVCAAFIVDELSWRKRRTVEPGQEKDYLVSAMKRYDRADSGEFFARW